ncbi:MAG: hypothetical protein FJX70_04240 [Alphaproteobacteria bacterium]|nr:hypothetical protein [Alphaproteobacteria bacterium]
MKEKEEGKEKEKMQTKFKLEIDGGDYYAETDYTKSQPFGSPVTTPKGIYAGAVWKKDGKLTLKRPSDIFEEASKSDSSITLSPITVSLIPEDN